jgi:predicted glycoside hydrolase/deacetylase ChbG (UPF0249 family)
LNKSQTNRLLGYPADARLLLINADDFGMCHAINEAIFRTLTDGLVRSTTLMVPCPWALELLAQVKLDELEAEFRAQIEAVLAAQLKPTHLDWHSLRLGGRTDIFDLMLGLAKEYGLAMRVMGRHVIEQVQGQGLPSSDYDFLDSFLLDPVDKAARFSRLLRELPAGLSEWAVHPGLDNAELQAIQSEGAQQRQTDYDFLMSQEAQDVVKEEGIILLDYRPLQAVWRRRGA